MTVLNSFKFHAGVFRNYLIAKTIDWKLKPRNGVKIKISKRKKRRKQLGHRIATMTNPTMWTISHSMKAEAVGGKKKKE